jgi:hypothetical protein
VDGQDSVLRKSFRIFTCTLDMMAHPLGAGGIFQGLQYGVAADECFLWDCRESHLHTKMIVGIMWRQRVSLLTGPEV